MSKALKERVRAERERLAKLKMKSSAELRRAKEALDKARNTAQVTVFRRALAKTRAAR